MINKMYLLFRNFTIRQKYHTVKKHTVKKHTPGKNIIDYGCGTGTLLKSFAKKNWKTLGFELDKNARQIATSRNQLTVYPPEQFYTLKKGSFDAIMLWHVLEHVHDVHELLAHMHEILVHKGVLFIAVPNISSWDSAYYGPFWAALDVPRHLYHFNHEAIHHLLTQHGFARQKIKPLRLDAFYISLLSEKYKYGHANLPRAFMTGLISNMKASTGNKNFSSNLYIYSKT
ncbi:MAG: class I SAM-dependent methyltransferase [Bacteroidales bacterium]